MAKSVPNPTGPKYILVYDQNGGESYQVQVFIDPITGLLMLDNMTISNTVNKLLASVALVDLNSAGDKPLFTVPGGKNAVIRAIAARNASISLSTVSFSVGWNAGVSNDVVATAVHALLTTALKVDWLAVLAGAVIGGPGGVLNLKNNILQGAPATATFDIFGYLF